MSEPTHPAPSTSDTLAPEGQDADAAPRLLDSLTSARTRMPSLDALRALCLWGIAAANAPMIAWPEAATFLRLLPLETAADRWAFHFEQAFLQGHFYPLYALLFGVGLGLMIARREATGAPTRAELWSRCVTLFAIGVAHATLLWTGDILTSHALNGFLLLLLATRSRRALFWIGGAVLLFGISVFLALFAAMAYAGESAGQLEEMLNAMSKSFDADLARFSQGSWLELARHRVSKYPGLLLSGLMYLPTSFSMSAFGFAIARSGLMARASEHPRRWRSLAIIFLSLGGLVSVVQVVASTYGTLELLGTTQRALILGCLLGGLAFAFGLFALALCTPSLGTGRWGAALARMGRLSLSHYLTQSLIFTTLVSGWGFGLYGRLGPATLLAIATAVWILQLLLSGPWLARFHVGPAEWLLRSLAKRERQPFVRRAPGASAIAPGSVR